MSNTIGWGKGASTNSIGWGQGAVNNVKNWGGYYRESFSAETSLGGELGLFVANNFQSRVIDDGVTFEAKSCLVEFLNEINFEPLILTNKFKERVSADLGTFEAKQCLIELLNTI